MRCDDAPTPRRADRAGFTLVELLVAIIIVAILAAIITPAVMTAMAKAKQAAIKTEIDMLHMAIMNYKSEYGSFPPAADMPAGAVAKHVTRLFPRNAFALGTAATNPAMAALQPDNAINSWLKGFTDDPTNPLGLVASGSGYTVDPTAKRKKLFDFDQSRLNSTTFRYAPREKPNSPYIYIPASQYAAATSPNPPMTFTGLTGSYAPEKDSTGAFFNADTFQILCAGRDEVFGTGDDLSNFWSGTRQDYKDGVK